MPFRLESRIERDPLNVNSLTKKKSVTDMRSPTEEEVKELRKEHAKEGSNVLKRESVTLMSNNISREIKDVVDDLESIGKKLADKTPGNQVVGDAKQKLIQKQADLQNKQKELDKANKWIEHYNKVDESQQAELLNTLETKAKSKNLDGVSKRLLYALDEGNNGDHTNEEGKTVEDNYTEYVAATTETGLNTQEIEQKRLIKSINSNGKETSSKSEGKRSEYLMDRFSEQDGDNIQIIMDQGDKYISQFAKVYQDKFNASDSAAGSSSRATAVRLEAIQKVTDQMEKDFQGQRGNAEWELRKLEMYLQTQANADIVARLEKIVENTRKKEERWYGTPAQRFYLGALIAGSAMTVIYNYGLVRAWEKH